MSLKLVILLIDDEPDIREVMKIALGDSSIEFFEADNAAQAMERMQNIKFDLVITDFNMPVTNGIELTKKIKAFDAAVPVILCSSDVWLTEETVFNAGAIKLIRKGGEHIETLKNYLEELRARKLALP